jgi:CheY-like chemotaxis protein
LPRFRSGSPRDRKIEVPGLEGKDGCCRILLVDDAPVNLAVCSRLLGRMACKVEPAVTGDFALAMFRDGLAEARYDMILMDMNMPGKDGLETCRAIRKLEAELPAEHPYRSRPVPILILTSKNPGDKVKEYRKAGANDFLYKPFQPDVVGEALARWIPVRVS